MSIRVYPWFYPPMSRPLRAGFEGVFCTQGVALGCVCRAPSGLPSAPFCVHLRFISPVTLCRFVANPLLFPYASLWLISFLICASAVSFSHFLGVLGGSIPAVSIRVNQWFFLHLHPPGTQTGTTRASGLGMGFRQTGRPLLRAGIRRNWSKR